MKEFVSYNIFVWSVCLGFREVPSGAQVLIPTPSVRGPSSVDSGYETQNYSRKPSDSVRVSMRHFPAPDVDSTAVSHSYNPVKYGVAAPQQFYDTSYLPKEVQVSPFLFTHTHVYRHKHMHTHSEVPIIITPCCR